MKTPPLRRRLALSVIAVAAIVTGGCAGVYTLAPVGEKPATLDPAKWEGTWFNDNQKTLQVKVVDRTTGELLVSSTEEHNGKPKTETITVLVRESGKRLFANVAETAESQFGGDEREPNSKEVRYAWAMIKLQSDMLVVWGPDVVKFTALVKAGKLKGREVKGGDVILEPLTDKETRALASEELGVPLLWDAPELFRRISPSSP